MRAMNILLVETDRRAAEFLHAGLTQHGLYVTVCPSAEAFGRAIGTLEGQQAWVVDVPQDDSRPMLDALRAQRQQGWRTPTILLMHRSELDYLEPDEALSPLMPMARPFFIEDLVLRLQHLDELTSGQLTLDRVQCRVSWQHHSVELGCRDFQLLEQLVSAQGRAFSSALLQERIWGGVSSFNAQQVDLSVRRLRAKLVDMDDSGLLSNQLERVLPQGYRFRRLAA